MPLFLCLALLFCSLNLAWAQPAPAPDPATRAALTGRGGAPSQSATDVRTVCAAAPGLQSQVINPRTATPPPVDCAQVLGSAPPTSANLAAGAQIAPFRVEARSARGDWRALGSYGSEASAVEAAEAACQAPAQTGTAQLRAARVTQADKTGSKDVDCRAIRAR